eukprot:2162131-Prymnesium_polylepis.1
MQNEERRQKSDSRIKALHAVHQFKSGSVRSQSRISPEAGDSSGRGDRSSVRSRRRAHACGPRGSGGCETATGVMDLGRDAPKRGMWDTVG